MCISPLKILICHTHLCRGFEVVVPGTAHNRLPAGILGLLCKLHYPGVLVIAGEPQAAYSWEHYKAANDAEDREGRIFLNKASRVVHELWVSVTCTTLLNHSVDLYFGMMKSFICAGFLPMRARDDGKG